jgi:excisionase family DNA binding protein
MMYATKQNPPTSLPFAQKATCTVEQARQATGLSRTFIYERIADGKLRSVTVGRRRLINVASLLSLVGAGEESE